MVEQDGRISFEKILNVRDIGKHINHFHGQNLLKEGLFFRSARLDAATPADRSRLVDELKIKTIIDLRTPTEHLEQAQNHGTNPLQIPGSEYKHINFNGSAYSNALIRQLGYWDMAKLFSLYAFGYRKDAISILGQNVMAARGLDGLARDSLVHCKVEIKQVFDVLCDEESYAVLVHCTQGKDRTGLVVLLALLLCGVPEEGIHSDYRVSESELLPEREEKFEEIRSIGLPYSFADCPEDWVHNVSSYIDQTCGGVEIYLEECGVTKERQNVLRSLLNIA